MNRTHNRNSDLGSFTALNRVLEAALEPVRNTVEAFTSWRPLVRLDQMIRVSRTRRDLRELDDRILCDIGVSRIDIERESRRHFWDIDDM